MAKRLPVPIVVAAVLFVLAMGALMDLFGLSERLIHIVLTGIFLFIPAFAALRLTHSEPEGFFLGSRHWPHTQNSAALLGVLAAVALLRLSRHPSIEEGLTLALAIGVALALVGVLSGPWLQGQGAYSLRQALENVFRNPVLRLFLLLLGAGSTFLLLCAGLDVAVENLRNAFALGKGQAIVLASGLIVLPALLGGAAASLEELRFASVTVLAALALPLLLQGIEFDAELTSGLPWGAMLLRGALIGFGLAGLPPVLLCAQCASTAHEAREGIFKTMAIVFAMAMIFIYLVRGRLGFGVNEPEAGLIGGVFGPVSVLQSGLESLSAAGILLLPVSFGSVALQAFCACLSIGTPRKRPDFAPLSSVRVAQARLILGAGIAIAAALEARGALPLEQMQLAAVSAGGVLLLAIGAARVLARRTRVRTH